MRRDRMTLQQQRLLARRRQATKVLSLSMGAEVRLFLSLFLMAALCFLLLSPSFAQEGEFELQEEAAQTMLEFDAGVIEDVDLRRLEFGAITARGDGIKKKHLYRKMMTFEREINESFREFRYQQ